MMLHTVVGGGGGLGGSEQSAAPDCYDYRSSCTGEKITVQGVGAWVFDSDAGVRKPRSG